MKLSWRKHTQAVIKNEHGQVQGYFGPADKFKKFRKFSHFFFMKKYVGFELFLKDIRKDKKRKKFDKKRIWKGRTRKLHVYHNRTHFFSWILWPSLLHFHYAAEHCWLICSTVSGGVEDRHREKWHLIFGSYSEDARERKRHTPQPGRCARPRRNVPPPPFGCCCIVMILNCPAVFDHFLDPPEIIPVGQFSRRWITSINQA